MVKYTVYSKWKSEKHWMPERSYTLKSYANQVAKGLKTSGRSVKIVEEKKGRKW